MAAEITGAAPTVAPGLTGSVLGSFAATLVFENGVLTAIDFNKVQYGVEQHPGQGGFGITAVPLPSANG